jgi:hypothetical protein
MRSNKKNWEKIVAADWEEIKNVPDGYQTLSMIQSALSQSKGMALRYVSNKTPKLCMIAVTLSPNANPIVYVEDQSKEICLVAVKKNGLMLQFIKNQDVDICLAAMANNAHSYLYVNICDNSNFDDTIKNLLALDIKNKVKDKMKKEFS